MSPNNGILLNGVLRPKLLNNPFASCSFINLEFLLLHTAYFDNNIVLPFLVFNTSESTFYVFLLRFKQYPSMFYSDLYMKSLELILFPLLFLFYFILITLFVIITFFEPILSVCFLQLKQQVCMFYNDENILLTTYFKDFLKSS